METTIPTTGVDSSSPTLSNFLNGKSLAEVESSLKGENPYEFRIAEQALDTHENYPTVRITQPTESTPTEMASIDPTFSQHQPLTGKPFAASFYKLDKVFNDIEQSDRVHLQKIDSYIRQRISSGRVADTPQAAISLIKSLEKQINLKDYHDPYYKAERVAAYLDTIKQYNSVAPVKIVPKQSSTDKVGILKQMALKLIRAL